MNRRGPYLGEAPSPAPAPQFRDEAFQVVIKQTLAENAVFDDLRQALDKDGDFIAVSKYGTSTGSYNIAFRDATNKLMSSARMSNTNGMGTAALPLPFGSIQYPAGGQISFSIENTYAGQNVIEIVVDGIKRVPV